MRPDDGQVPGPSPYAYCANNPVVLYDPTGKEFEWYNDFVEGIRQSGHDLMVSTYRTLKAFASSMYHDPMGTTKNIASNITFMTEHPDLVLSSAKEYITNRYNVGAYGRGYLAGRAVAMVGPFIIARGTKVQGLESLSNKKVIFRNPGITEYELKTVRHHLLPRQYIDYFECAGLNIDDFTVIMTRAQHQLRMSPGIHTIRGGNWNEQWKIFKDEYRNASAEQILQHLESMRKDFGL